jgi:hypothetical protein
VTWTAGNLTLSTGGIFDNMVGGTLDVRSNLNLAQSGSGNGFRNHGTVLRSAGTGLFNVDVNFSNFPGALVRGETGTTRFSVGMTNSGRFEFLPGTTLGTLGGGGRTFDPTSSLVADTFNAGMGSSHHTVTVSGDYDVATTIVSFSTSAPLGASAGLFFSHPDTMPNLVMGPSGTHSRLSVAGDLRIPGSLNWQGGTGTMEGAGTTTLDPGATATLGGSSMVLTGRTLRNETNAVWTGATLMLSTGGIFDNMPGASVDIRANVTLAQSGTGNGFRNYGTVLRSAGTGIANMNANFSNFVDGLVRGETGTVRFSSGLTNSGRFEFIPGAVLETFGNPGKVFDATSSLTAATFRVGGDDGFHNVTVLGNYDVAHTIIDFCGSCGSLAASTGLFITHPDTLPNLTLEPLSRLSVAGDMLITGTLAWNQGTLEGAGTTTLAPGATAFLATSGLKVLEGRTFLNDADAIWSAGDLSLRNGGRFENLTGALFEAQGVTTLSQSGTGNAFINYGEVLRTTSAGRLTLNAPFVNTVAGLVRGEIGIVRYSSNLTNSGRFEFLPGTTLETFGNPSKVFDATSSLVASTFNVGGDDGFHTVTISGDYDVEHTIVDFCHSCGALAPSTGLFFTHPDTMTNLTLAPLSRLSVTGDLLVTGTLTWNEGIHVGPGTTTLAPGASAVVSGPNQKTLDGRGLRNEGTVTWSGGEFQLNNGAVIENVGDFLARFDGLMRRTVGTQTSYFYNTNLFRKEASTGTTNIDGGICFVNTGVVDVDTGILRFSGCYPSLTGTYNVATTLQIDAVPVPDCSQASITLETSGATIVNASAQSLVGSLDCIDNTGSLTVLNGKNQSIPGALQNSGSVNVGTGSSLTMGGNYTQTAGTTIVEGTLGAPLIDIAGGLVRAQGLFNGDTRNSGRLEIGVPIGTLNINGYYHQTSSGVLAFDIGGRIAGAEYDQLIVSEPAIFDGTIEIHLANGFMPTGGDCFDLILYPSQTGTFATVVTPSLAAGLAWTVEYGETSLRVCVVDAGVNIAGTVTSDCEGALADILVILADGSGAPDSTTTGADGSFAFSDVPASETPGQISVVLPAGFEPVAPIPVPLDADQMVDVAVACKFVSVAGSVTSGCGEGPLAGLTVTLSPASPLAPLVTTTGLDGSYSFTGIRYSEAPASLSVAAPAGFEPVTPIAIDLTADRIADVAPACVLVSISGSVTSDCNGPEGGVQVSLAVVGRDPLSTATAADGSYALSVRYSATPGDLSITIPAGLSPLSPPEGTAEVALTDDQTSNFTLHCQEVSVSGVVSSDCGGPLLGITVDLLDAEGEFHTTTTNASGAYLFEGLEFSSEVDAAEVSIAIPLGHEAVSPGVAGAAITLDQDRVVDFSLACLDPSGAPRSMGYWKHNANVYLSGRGNAQETQANMTTNYPQAIFSHFFENALNDIPVEGVTYMGSPPAPLDLATIGSTLTVNNGGTMLARAKQQYLAFLLNVASGKLATSAVVTADGGTASQVLQYAADLINDGNASNDELAKNLGDTINNAQMIAAGVVPIEQYGDISYAMRRFGNMPLQVSPNPGTGSPHPYVFSFGMPIAGEATLEIYDVSGRLVATPLARALATGEQQVVWEGSRADGRRVAQGVYFARLATPEGSKAIKFVHMGR